MNIEQKISEDFIKAFKERDTFKKTLLGVVKGEIETAKKKKSSTDLFSDNDALDILNKFAKNLRENIRVANDDKSKQELAIISEYLPAQLSDAEVNSKLDALISSGITNLGAIMKEFGKLPVDKKMLSELVKQKLGA